MDLHRLLFEPIAEFVVDLAGDFAAGFGEVVVGGGGFVDEDEGGFVADTDAVEEFAFETCLLNKPAGVDFVAVFAVMNWVAFVGGDFGLFFGEVDIVEEGAGAGFF